MNFVKILLIALVLLPITSDARGYLVPVVPSASFTIGGNQSHTVVTGEKIPTLRWKSTNGKSFKTTLNVNNSALCGGIKNNQAWGQSNSAAGSFDLGLAPKAREGCVLTFNYEVTSRTGHQRTSRATLKYVAPVVSPLVPTKPVVVPVFDPKVVITHYYVDRYSFDKIHVEWTAENINSDYEFHVFMREVDSGELMMQLGRLKSSVRSQTFDVPDEAFDSNYEIVIFVTQRGADTLLGAKKFYSEPFGLYRGDVDNTGPVVINTEFFDQGSSANNDDSTSRSYSLGFNILSTKDIYISPITSSESATTTSSGLIYGVEGVENTTFFTAANSYVNFGGKEFSTHTVNGLQYFKIPKNTQVEFLSTVTLSDVSRSGQYRIQLKGFNYLDDMSTSTTKWHNFVNAPEDPLYRSSYNTINSPGFFGGFFNKINSIGNSLGSVASGLFKILSFTR